MKLTGSFFLLSLFVSLTVISGIPYDARGGDSRLLKQIVNRIVPSQEKVSAVNQTCGFGNYNFSSMNQSEWMGFDQDQQFMYFLRLCGTVENKLCQADPLTQHSMLCQVQTNNSKMVYNIATDSIPAMNWTYINPSNMSAGVRLTMHNGDNCGSSPRTTIGLFTCGSSMGNFTVNTSAIDFGDCTYTLHIPTPLACVSENDLIEPTPVKVVAPSRDEHGIRLPKRRRNK